MDVDDIVRRVERMWPFTSRKYPALSGLGTEQVRAFALAHVLKHQAKSVNWLIVHARDSESGILERIQALILNSLQFAHLSGWSHKELEEQLSMWVILSSSPVEPDDPVLALELGNFARAILLAMALLEPADHGEPLPNEQLQACTAQFMLCSLQIARMYCYTRRDFEERLHSLETV